MLQFSNSALERCRTRVDPSGENFDITWNDYGHTNTLWHFELDIIELISEPPSSRSRATSVPG